MLTLQRGWKPPRTPWLKGKSWLQRIWVSRTKGHFDFGKSKWRKSYMSRWLRGKETIRHHVAKEGNVSGAKCRTCFIKGYLIYNIIWNTRAAYDKLIAVGYKQLRVPKWSNMLCLSRPIHGCGFLLRFWGWSPWRPLEITPFEMCIENREISQHEINVPTWPWYAFKWTQRSINGKDILPPPLQQNCYNSVQLSPQSDSNNGSKPFRLFWLRFVAWKWRLQLDMWSWTICTSVILVFKVREANREGLGDKTRPRKGGPSRGLWNAYIEMVLIHEDGLKSSIKKNKPHCLGASFGIWCYIDGVEW